MYLLFLTDSYSKELRGFQVIYNQASLECQGIRVRKLSASLYGMYIKLYCLKFEVRSSNTKPHTAKA